MTQIKYELDKCEGQIVVEVEDGSGSITSNLKVITPDESEDLDAELDELMGDALYDAAIDGLEALILACACAGIDVASLQFQTAVQTAIEGIANNTDSPDDLDDD